MEPLIISVCALTLLLTVINLFLLLKKGKGNAALSDADKREIRDTVRDTVNTMADSTAGLIAEKNKAQLAALQSSIEQICRQLTALEQAQTAEFRQLKDAQNDFFGKMLTFNNSLLRDSREQTEKMQAQLSRGIETLEANVKEKLNELRVGMKESIGQLEASVKDSLTKMREDNGEKLEKINASVNEKLEKTLESKLKDSFENVVKQISNVNVAVGEIRGLASDVGSLKNVLTNVKTKGIVGEVILGNIIREFLTAEQYEENVPTKKGSTERVEFAIRLPGAGEGTLYLPIDSKFPYEPYSRMLESEDVEEIKRNKQTLRANLLKYAKDVSDKYIDVPNTTDFAIIFLPLEGLYLEALNMGLFEEIRQKYKVNLTGPTTLSAFITSLQVGFKSLLIQKRSADVFRLLGAVKTEFTKFADTLEKTQRKVSDASDELDRLVGTRTRMIVSKLRTIDALDEDSTRLLIEAPKEE